MRQHTEMTFHQLQASTVRDPHITTHKLLPFELNASLHTHLQTPQTLSHKHRSHLTQGPSEPWPSSTLKPM